MKFGSEVGRLATVYMRAVAVVPAYQAGSTVGQVVNDLLRTLPADDGPPVVIVVDDGSRDDTAEQARRTGAEVVRHEHNRGKGAALRTGLARALELGADAVVTVDADGQHPAAEAARLARHPASADALVLAVRDLARDGAPRLNRFSNGISNFFLSWFAGQRLLDTQCGLRRYPARRTLALPTRDDGFAYEAEVVLRAAWADLELVQVPARVVYPPPERRTTHFRTARDPAKIIYRVLHTVATTRRSRRSRRWLRAGLLAIGVTAFVLAIAHFGIARFGRLLPPAVEIRGATVVESDGRLQTLGASYLLQRDKITEVGLVGTVEEIGYAHARLLRAPATAVERALYGRFDKQVSWAAARWVLLDLAQLRYRHLDRQLGRARQRELAAMALGLQPDPFADIFPTYQRLVYLNALYDIALSFEQSPLVGCTSFLLNGPTPNGGVLLARNFDFEIDEVFDRRKAVLLVRESGQIPFLSVAWPGLTGVLSGMNAEGVAAVVHGARAGEPQSKGEPVTLAVRRVLSEAHDVQEGIDVLGRQDAMVSHIVILADALGRAAAVERLPGRRMHVRWLSLPTVVTNHFEGPFAADPKNQLVRRNTSSVSREERGKELVQALTEPPDVATAVGLLRDRRGTGGRTLDLGDRRAIDALIAAHGVVMDTAARVVWVSESPHLLGRFVAFDLRRQLAPSYRPGQDCLELPTLPEDGLLTSGEYGRWLAGAAR